MGACRFLHWLPPDDVIGTVPENILLQKKHWTHPVSQFNIGKENDVDGSCQGSFYLQMHVL